MFWSQDKNPKRSSLPSNAFSAGLPKGRCLLENGLGPNADSPVLCERAPDNRSVRVCDEHGGTGDVIPSDPTFWVAHSELINQFQFCVRQHLKLKALLFGCFQVFGNRIGADDQHLGVAFLERCDD